MLATLGKEAINKSGKTQVRRKGNAGFNLPDLMLTSL